MKEHKRTFILIEIILACLVAILALIMVWERTEEQSKISVIVQNPDDTEWSAFKYGLEKAAEDQKVDVTVVNTGTIRDVKQEKQVIEQEAKKGADAIVFQPTSGTDVEEVLEEVHVPVVLIEYVYSPGQEIATIPIVGPDQFEMGVKAAEEIIRDHAGDLSGKEIGFFSKTADSSVVLAREKGARETLENAGAKVRWFVSGDFEETPNEFLNGQSEVDILLALDDKSLVRWGAYAADMTKEIPTYGIGHSTEAIYYLDTDVVECLVVPDEFNMGYQSIREAVEKMEHYKGTLQNRKVSYKVIRREELFSKENQESLFTMSQ